MNNKIDKLKLGGLRRFALHGNPGTLVGRRKGGRKTIQLFHRNPQLAKSVGFVVRKEICYPKKSEEFAEFIGILLGDGGIPSNHQVTISFNYKTDREYAEFICTVLKKLFLVDCYMRKRKNGNGADIVVSSSNLVDFLLSQGMRKGSKTRNQIDAPCWIRERLEYQVACLRGLMDTDGGFYLHSYHSSGKNYKYLKLCFTNCSKPLLRFVYETLQNIRIKAYLSGNHVSVYSRHGVQRYFEDVGSHNFKHINRFREYSPNKLRRGAGAG